MPPGKFWAPPEVATARIEQAQAALHELLSWEQKARMVSFVMSSENNTARMLMVEPSTVEGALPRIVGYKLVQDADELVFEGIDPRVTSHAVRPLPEPTDPNPLRALEHRAYAARVVRGADGALFVHMASDFSGIAKRLECTRDTTPDGVERDVWSAHCNFGGKTGRLVASYMQFADAWGPEVQSIKMCGESEAMEDLEMTLRPPAGKDVWVLDDLLGVIETFEADLRAAEDAGET